MSDGFMLDNTLDDASGIIHNNLYVPEDYDSAKSYPLYIALPGWGGLYFQGVGTDLRERFAIEAVRRHSQMIVVSPQLNDWGETSARQAIALTEYLLTAYSVDPTRVYLSGYSGGGETGSIVMGMRPELYSRYLMIASQWDGDLSVLAQAKIPVYMVVGEADSYYGSEPMKQAYETLLAIYEAQGLTSEEIDALLILDVKDQAYFDAHGYSDQHMGGMAFAEDEQIMNWLLNP